jgi:DNA-binding response OmpR family regulator
MKSFNALGQITVGLLEEDADFRNELALGLGGYGFDVCFTADDAAHFYRCFEKTPTDIVILDANVPGDDGFSVATRMRARHAVGIIMLSDRVALEDRVRGLEGGVDIYLTKPIDLLELSSIIRSLMRRMRITLATSMSTSQQTEPTAVPGSWALAEGGWTLIDPWGRSLSLSAQEKIFMSALVNAAGLVVSRECLSQLFLPEDPQGFEVRRIDVLVSRLRSKSQALGMKLPVVSVRGKGYVFTA